MKYILIAAVILAACPAPAQKHEFNPITIPKGETFTATDDTYSAFGTLDVKALQKFPVDLRACRTTNFTLKSDVNVMTFKIELVKEKYKGVVIENYLMKGFVGALVLAGLVAGVKALVK